MTDDYLFKGVRLSRAFCQATGMPPRHGVVVEEYGRVLTVRCPDGSEYKALDTNLEVLPNDYL